jgi:hypothetical protein
MVLVVAASAAAAEVVVVVVLVVVVVVVVVYKATRQSVVSIAECAQLTGVPLQLTVFPLRLCNAFNYKLSPIISTISLVANYCLVDSAVHFRKFKVRLSTVLTIAIKTLQTVGG